MAKQTKPTKNTGKAKEVDENDDLEVDPKSKKVADEDEDDFDMPIDDLDELSYGDEDDEDDF